MEANLDLTKLSRTVSHALRHEPWLYGLELDSYGSKCQDESVSCGDCDDKIPILLTHILPPVQLILQQHQYGKLENDIHLQQTR